MPDLRNRFVMGAASLDSIGAVGGSTSHAHTTVCNSAGAHDHGGKTEGNSNSGVAATGTRTIAADDHHHTIARDGEHAHAVSVDSTATLPPHVGLLKIMRVR